MKQTKELKEWAEMVKARDGNRCVICGKEAGKGSGKGLNAHHILPKEQIATRFDIGNGITLCPKHHKFSNEMSAHKNPFVFYRWLFIHRNAQYCYILTKL